MYVMVSLSFFISSLLFIVCVFLFFFLFFFGFCFVCFVCIKLQFIMPFVFFFVCCVYVCVLFSLHLLAKSVQTGIHLYSYTYHNIHMKIKIINELIYSYEYILMCCICYTMYSPLFTTLAQWFAVAFKSKKNRKTKLLCF